MKAVVLAGGRGTRMGELSEDIPKVLVLVNGKPFLWYLLSHLQEAGFNELALIVGYKKEKIAEFVQEYGFHVTLLEQKEQLGTGDAALCARSFVGEDSFLLLSGDNLWSAHDMKAMVHHNDFTYMSVVEVDNPGKYGVVVAQDGFLCSFAEKPSEPVGNLVNAGMYYCRFSIFRLLERLTPSARGELEFTDALIELSSQRLVRVQPVKDYWLDLGCPDDVARVSNFLARLD